MSDETTDNQELFNSLLLNLLVESTSGVCETLGEAAEMLMDPASFTAGAMFMLGMERAKGDPSILVDFFGRDEVKDILRKLREDCA